MAEQRIKEIGIRKILGASVANLAAFIIKRADRADRFILRDRVARCLLCRGSLASTLPVSHHYPPGHS